MLIVLAPKEHKVRIETGYGLEGVLPDSWCGTTSRQAAKLYFSHGQYSQGMLASGSGRGRADIAADAGVQLTGATALQLGDNGAGQGTMVFVIVFFVMVHRHDRDRADTTSSAAPLGQAHLGLWTQQLPLPPRRIWGPGGRRRRLEVGGGGWGEWRRRRLWWRRRLRAAAAAEPVGKISPTARAGSQSFGLNPTPHPKKNQEYHENFTADAGIDRVWPYWSWSACGPGGYNSVIGMDEKVNNAWAEVDNQLKRRNDLVPELVNTVKGVAMPGADRLPGHRQRPQGLFRAQNSRPEASGRPANGRRPVAIAGAAGEYPQLKSNEIVPQAARLTGRNRKPSNRRPQAIQRSGQGAESIHTAVPRPDLGHVRRRRQTTPTTKSMPAIARIPPSIFPICASNKAGGQKRRKPAEKQPRKKPAEPPNSHVLGAALRQF